MISPLEKQRRRLQINYKEVVGMPFMYFYCPILFRDENVKLCKAHLVNAAFPGSKRWTIQRKDVDNFFGSVFESDFTNIQHRGKTPEEIILDPSLARRIRPKFVVDGSPVDHFFPTGPVPQKYSLLSIDGKSGPVQYGLKISPSKALTVAKASWQVHVDKDLRIPAIVSVLKAAHLIMFHMLGYRYALGPGGHFLGKTVLGNFFLQNATRSRKEVLANAVSYFREFAHLVRPVIKAPDTVKGTVADQLVFLCKSAAAIWAILVFVRTSHLLHAVLVPVFQDPIGAKCFVAFISGPNEKLEGHMGRFKGDHWEYAEQKQTLVWPKTGILYPD